MLLPRTAVLAATLALVLAASSGSAEIVAQAPPGGAAESAAQPGFGESVTLTAHPMIVKKGTATWDSAFDTLVDAFKTVKAYLDKEKVAPTGPPMTIYLSTDDTGFQFEAGYPVAEPPPTPPAGGDLAARQSPAGKALKFVHHGSYDAMDSTYEAITNYLDDKQLDAQDAFIEEYPKDPITTPEDQLIVNVYVPLK